MGAERWAGQWDALSEWLDQLSPEEAEQFFGQERPAEEPRGESESESPQ